MDRNGFLTEQKLFGPIFILNFQINCAFFYKIGNEGVSMVHKGLKIGIASYNLGKKYVGTLGDIIPYYYSQ